MFYAVGNNNEHYSLHSFESESIVDAIRLIYESLEEGCQRLDMRDIIEKVPPAPPIKKTPSKRLIVTPKDEERIELGSQSATFIRAIEMAGIEKVHALKLRGEKYPLIKHTGLTQFYKMVYTILL